MIKMENIHYSFILTVIVCFSSQTSGFKTQFQSNVQSKPNEFLLKLASNSIERKDSFESKASSSEDFTILKSTKVGDKPLFLIRSSLSPDELTQTITNHFADDVSYVTTNVISHGYHGYGTNINDTPTKFTYDCSDDPGEAPCQSHPTGNTIWGLSRISQVEALDGSGDFNYTWSASNDGSGVVVYVMDTGVFDAHNEFNNIDAQWGFTASGITDYEGNGDYNGHGTHVAGIVAGHNFGVAKAANIISVKVLDTEGSGTGYDFLEGLDFIITDVINRYEQTGQRPKAIVNLSLGFSAVFDIVDEAIRYGTEMGIIYVAAAGNDGLNACLSSPASSPDTITVGAVDNLDTVTWFSNYGACIDILAPGDDIISAGHLNDTHTEIFDGTSMACPFVVGVIARYLSHSDDVSDVTCVREHLFNTAITGSAIIPSDKPGTVNRLLFAGCNTCFGATACEPEFGLTTTSTAPPWWPDENGAICIAASCVHITALLFVTLVTMAFRDISWK